jgi:hypothetical protein
MFALKINLKYFALLASTLLTFSLAAQEQRTITTAVPFLLISPDSRVGGMGETNAAIADQSTAVYWNPAGLGFQKGGDVNLNFSRWLPSLGGDLGFYNISAKRYLQGLGTFGLGFTYLNLGESIFTNEVGATQGTFRSFEFALGLSYGVRVAKTFSVGTSVRFIRSQLTPTSFRGVGTEETSGVGTSVGFDLSWLWKPRFIKERFSIGMNLSNVGPKVTYTDAAQADPLPTNLRLGLAFKLVNSRFNKITLSTDFSKLMVNRAYFGLDGQRISFEEVERRINALGNAPDSVKRASYTTRTDGVFNALISSWGADGGGFNSFTIGAGGEYLYGDPGLLALRAGYFYEDPRFGGRQYITFGFGLRYAAIGLDFSYISSTDEQSPLDGTLRISVTFNFQGTRIAKQ